MTCFRLTEHLRRSIRIAVLVSAVSGALGQAQRGADVRTILQGTVRDSGNRPVVGAKVCLQSKNPVQTLTVITDLDGHYQFSNPSAGTYTLYAEMPGVGETSLDPVVLPLDKAKLIDLKLSKPSMSSTAQAPEFYDEPHFTVAGVSDTTNLGGHGSDVVVRTTETLARDTASLGRNPSAVHPPDTYKAEKALRDQLARDPESFKANQQLGTLLADTGRARDGLPYLEHASRLRPDDAANGYELALAKAGTGELDQAQTDVKRLLARRDTAELHHLLAEIEEKRGSPVEAVREYQRAAELNPSESNLFDWGSDLLLHSAVDPALEVFGKGHRLFPTSARMLVGLGVAFYGRGSYEQAVSRLCAASDLNPGDPTPYFFLGKFESAEPTSSPASVERLERFAKLEPENAQANYFYALSLWNSRQGNDDKVVTKVNSLLEKALHLDPKLGAAFLEIGILKLEKNDLLGALASFQKAVDASPQLAQAHYRLAQTYRQTGDSPRAQTELELYTQISRNNAEEAVRERREIQQFVYTLRNGSATKPSP